MNLSDLNRWWFDKKVPAEFIGRRRDALNEVLPLFERKQILLIEGIRRVGKTTLMYQIIDDLIKRGISPFNILYFTFDISVVSPEDILKEYRNTVLKKDLRSEKIYVFFDEIQKFEEWWNTIKVLYDIYPNIKFCLSGSVSTLLKKKVRESLAGRVFTYFLKPLSFPEFLRFRNVKIDYNRMDLFEDLLAAEIVHYLKTSGFIEIITEQDDTIVRRYFLETVFERIVYMDIPRTFGIEEPELLKEIFKIISENPGAILHFASLANDLNRDRRTIEKYIGYLKNAFLIIQLFNYSPNMLTSRKKNKKFYPSYTAFSYVTTPNMLVKDAFLGKMVENVVASELNAKFFYRDPRGNEVDIIYAEQGEIIPVEVKFRNFIEKKAIKLLTRFMKEFKVNKGIIISKHEKNVIETEVGMVHVIPFVEFLLTIL